MDEIHSLIRRRDHAAASQQCLNLARAISDIDALASFHLRITAGFLDLIEHGTPNPHALEELETLLDSIVREVDCDDRIAIDLAAITEFCRLFRLCLTGQIAAVAEIYVSQRDGWLTFGGGIEIMSLMIASLCLLNRDLRSASSVAEVPMVDRLRADIAALLKRRGLHRYVSEVLIRCDEFLDTLAHGVVMDGDAGGLGFLGHFPAKNPWMLCAESQLRVSTALARKVIMTSKYNITATVVNVIERNDAPINIDARAVDVDASVGKKAPCAPPRFSDFEHSADYDRIVLHGLAYRFGMLQSRIIRMLHAASSSPSPWVPEEQVLADVGAKSRHFRDIFKNHDRDALFEYDDLNRVRLRL